MQDRFESFTVLINRINRNIRKIKNREMAEYSLKSAHISCLYFLRLSDGLTATDLSERCEEDKATISRAVGFLEKNGYLICKAKHEKRYKSPLCLTAKGRAVAEKIAAKVEKVLSEVSRGLSEEERIAFYRYLEFISNNLNRISTALS